MTMSAGCGKSTGNETEWGGNQQDTQNQDDGTGSYANSNDAAMGRYLGTETDIGERINSEIAIMKEMDDGSIVIQDFFGTRIVSMDRGKTWQDVQGVPSLQSLMRLIMDNNFVFELELAKDGSMAICYAKEILDNSET